MINNISIKFMDCDVVEDGIFTGRTKCKIKLNQTGFEAKENDIIYIIYNPSNPKGIVSCSKEKRNSADRTILASSCIEIDDDTFNVYMIIFNELVANNFDLTLRSLTLEPSTYYMKMITLAFVRRNKLELLLKKLLESEIRDDNTVIRESSPFTNIINQLFEFPECDIYRREITGKLVKSVLNISHNVLSKNKLKKIISKFIKEFIIKEGALKNNVIKTILHIISSNTNGKSKKNILSSILFLRFINSVVSPHNNYHNHKRLTEFQKRNLILCTRILQKASTGIPFEEPELEMFNNDIKNWHNELKRFWNKLSLSNSVVNFEITKINDIQMVNVMENIYYFILQNQAGLDDKNLQKVILDLTSMGANPTKLVPIDQGIIDTPINTYITMLRNNLMVLQNK